MNTEQIASLERLNYVAMQPIAKVTPGLETIIQDDVILTSSETYPTPDATHACLLQSDTKRADTLITEVIAYFQSKALPPTVFLSPACTPSDLPKRLLKHGFQPQREKEAWLVLQGTEKLVLATPDPDVPVRQIDKSEAQTFAEVFMASFDMPQEYAPMMAQVLEPSINLPDVYHYIAFMDERPVGVCSLIFCQEYGILGSAGIVPVRRGGKILASLASAVISAGQQRGIQNALLQTTAGSRFERFLRISGFKRAFTRTCYTMS